MLNQHLVVCGHCDAVYQRPRLSKDRMARCTRCGATLCRGLGANLNYLAAMALTCLIAFLIANFFPIVQLDVRADRSATTLWGAVVATWNSGYPSLAIMVAICALLYPLVQICIALYLVLPLRLGRKPPGFANAMHLMRLTWPWSAVEVFMLGAIVAVVKLDHVAAVVIGPGFYGFGALTLLLTLVGAFDMQELWDASERAQPINIDFQKLWDQFLDRLMEWPSWR